MAENRIRLALVATYNENESDNVYVLDIRSLEKVDNMCFIIKLEDTKAVNSLPIAAGELLDENVRNNIIYNLQMNSPGAIPMLE